MLQPITIVGGGLAGLTLGIALRREGTPVTLIEAGNYPRHRVCGEFISGEGQAILEGLGLLALFKINETRLARTALFHAPQQRAVPFELPTPALCISRHLLDAELAHHFTQLGGELRVGERFREAFSCEGIVQATGRVRAPASRAGNLGLKVHASRLELEADLEMHLFDHGYIGLCRLPNNEVNICGLFWGFGRGTTVDLLRGPAGGALATKLARAAFDMDSFSSVAGVDLQPSDWDNAEGISVGDAMSMIPPITGNGMSIAFESALCAVGPLRAYAGGEMTWAQARQAIATAQRETFRSRIRNAARLQRCLQHPRGQKWIARALRQFPGLIKPAFKLTR